MLVYLFLMLLLGLPLPAFGAAATCTWVDNSSGDSQELYFVLERGPGCSGPWTDIAHPPQDTQIYVDTMVLAGSTYCYKIKGVNAGGPGPYSNTDSVTISVGTLPGVPGIACVYTNPATTLVASINFQPTSVALPAGYQKDDGSVYSTARGYGWDQNLGGYTRDRDVNADQRLDTFVYVAAGTTATWSYTMPNGSYLISLAAGDASWAQGPHRIQIEGAVVVNNVTTAGNTYVTRTDVPVSVTDGQLSVKLGGTGAGNTMLNYLVIKR